MRHLVTALLLVSHGIAAAEPFAERGADTTSLTLQVTGSIPDRCLLGRIDDIDLGDLNVRAAQRDLAVQLDCNLPFSISIQAANGALAHTTMPGGQGPYAGRLPYQIDLTLPVRRPAAETISQTFESHNLLIGQTLSSRGGIASDGMRLTLSLGQPGGEAGLLGGSYSETIEITVTPD